MANNSSIMILNYDVLSLILEFNGPFCHENSIYLVNKYFYNFTNVPRCDVSFYEFNKKCLIHDGNDEYTVFKILSESINNKTIHFNNKKQLELSLKYINKLNKGYFKCCGGTGIVFNNFDFFREYDRFKCILVT